MTPPAARTSKQAAVELGAVEDRAGGLVVVEIDATARRPMARRRRSRRRSVARPSRGRSKLGDSRRQPEPLATDVDDARVELDRGDAHLQPLAAEARDRAGAEAELDGMRAGPRRRRRATASRPSCWRTYSSSIASGSSIRIAPWTQGVLEMEIAHAGRFGDRHLGQSRATARSRAWRRVGERREPRQRRERVARRRGGERLDRLAAQPRELGADRAPARPARCASSRRRRVPRRCDSATAAGCRASRSPSRSRSAGSGAADAADAAAPARTSPRRRSRGESRARRTRAACCSLPLKACAMPPRDAARGAAARAPVSTARRTCSSTGRLELGGEAELRREDRSPGGRGRGRRRNGRGRSRRPRPGAGRRRGARARRAAPPGRRRRRGRCTSDGCRARRRAGAGARARAPVRSWRRLPPG